MCSVSAVSQYYTEIFPQRLGQPLHPSLNNPNPIPPIVTFDLETKEMMRQALRLLDKIDKRLGDIECIDGAKNKFLESLGLDPSAIGG